MSEMKSGKGMTDGEEGGNTGVSKNNKLPS